MDKAEMRAMASDVFDGPEFTVDSLNNEVEWMKCVAAIETALTDAYEAGWDEGVEAVAEEMQVKGYYSVPVLIRRLKKDKE